MGELFNEEPFKSLATAGIGGGVLLVAGKVIQLVQSVIERRLPSVEVEHQGERQFSETLIERIQLLEEARDKLAKDITDFGQRYWELTGKYQALETAYKTLEASNVLLQQQHANLLGEYKKLRARLDAVTTLDMLNEQAKGEESNGN